MAVKRFVRGGGRRRLRPGLRDRRGEPRQARESRQNQKRRYDLTPPHRGQRRLQERESAHQSGPRAHREDRHDAGALPPSSGPGGGGQKEIKMPARQKDRESADGERRRQRALAASGERASLETRERRLHPARTVPRAKTRERHRKQNEGHQREDEDLHRRRNHLNQIVTESTRDRTRRRVRDQSCRMVSQKRTAVARDTHDERAAHARAVQAS